MQTAARVAGTGISVTAIACEWAHCTLAGIHVDLATASMALERIVDRCEDRAAPPLAVISANLDHIHHFGPRTPGGYALERSGGSGLEILTLLDGMPLVRRASHLTGSPWPRLAGSDLAEPLLDRAEEHGLSVGFLGGSPQTHDLLKRRLGDERPGLRVAGWWAPERTTITDPALSTALAADVREAGVDILLVGLGKPRQEMWIAQHGAATGARVLLAFGAAVDFLAGRVSRAPAWVAEHGLEWAYRLSREPKRLSRRYLIQGPGAYRELRRSSWGSAHVAVTRASAGTAGSWDDVPTGSVVIPAHNEAAVIGTTLESLRPLLETAQVQAVVACNACTDETAKIARSFPGVTVVEIEQASKVAALNAAEAVAQGWPRIYLDADIAIPPQTVRALLTALDTERAAAARPPYRYGTQSASVLVRAYYGAGARTHGSRTDLWGAGVFALNAAGRGRFGAFPDVTADDVFVSSLFADDERMVPDTLPVTVQVPRTTKSLLAVARRNRRGASAMVARGAEATTASTVRRLLDTVRRPADVADLLVYAGVACVVRVQARFGNHGNGLAWERDDTTRRAPRA